MDVSSIPRSHTMPHPALKLEFLFIASREVRVIPAGWQHPRDARGGPIPLLPEQMPDAGAHTEIAAYETTSEGTPISPTFPDSPAGRLDLVRHCAAYCTVFGEHRSGEEGWAAILFGEHAVIAEDGTVRLD